jgi:hypothetical protein
MMVLESDHSPQILRPGLEGHWLWQKVKNFILKRIVLFRAGCAVKSLIGLISFMELTFMEDTTAFTRSWIHLCSWRWLHLAMAVPGHPPMSSELWTHTVWAIISQELLI